MANLIGFIDETGVLQKHPSQRFFALGLLQMETTAPFYEELSRLKARIINKLQRLQGPFEFKFNDINRTNFSFYRELIDLYFQFHGVAFTAFVIDKQSPHFAMEKFFGDVWDAYIGYSKLIIGKSVGPKDRIFILADYLSKPKASPKFYEIEVARSRSRGRTPVYNACMIESHASLFIQLVDVLIGCVVFDFRMKALSDSAPNQFKRELVELVRGKLGVDTLAGEMKKKEPNRFTVRPFKMQ